MEISDIDVRINLNIITRRRGQSWTVGRAFQIKESDAERAANKLREQLGERL